MEIDNLKTSCLCGNTQSYHKCCAVYANKNVQYSSWSEAVQQYWDFRHILHDIHKERRALSQIQMNYENALKASGFNVYKAKSDGMQNKALVENFLWDYFVQYSDARPILRLSRELDPKEIRLAHTYLEWAFCPLSLYQVMDEEKDDVLVLRHFGNEKIHRVFSPEFKFEKGNGLIVRLLPFRGKEYFGITILALPEELLSDLFAAFCQALKIKSTIRLRPDVHGEEWKAHGHLLLNLWLNAQKKKSKPKVNAKSKSQEKATVEKPYSVGINQPNPALVKWAQKSLPALGDESPHLAAQHDMGKHRLRAVLKKLQNVEFTIREAEKYLQLN